MTERGLTSLFPIEEIAIIGVVAILQQLPALLARIRETVDAVVAEQPDCLVIIDSPEFNQRVARRVRLRAPSIPIVNYVSPTVWAWRPGRARAMARSIDRVMALLPFEPAVHQRLKGPPTTYVGHPLIEQIGRLRPNAEEAARRDQPPPVILVLPGSRRGEIRRHIEVVRQTLAKLVERGLDADFVLPTTAHLEAEVRAAIADWPVPVRVITGEDNKQAAFRIARAALAKSGTVTLELALAHVPTVAFYKTSPVEFAIARRLVALPSVILANLVAGQNVIPEFLQHICTPDNLAAALLSIVPEGAARQNQLDGFDRIDTVMATPEPPSAMAADVVIAHLRKA